MKITQRKAGISIPIDWALCGGALVLLVLALVVSSRTWISLILAVLSFLASAASLRQELLEALRKRDFRSGLLLLVIAGVLCLCTGKSLAAAAALFLRSIGSRLLPLWKGRVLNLMNTRKELSPLSAELPDPAEIPSLAQSTEKLLNNYLTFLMVFLAALVAVLTAIAGRAGIAAAISRAAVVLALGGTCSLFAGFPLSDYAAALRAGESGVLFRGQSLPGLMEKQLACVQLPAPKVLGSAAVFPARAEAVSPELMMHLAFAACEESGLPAEKKLTSIVQSNFDKTEVERQILPGYGAVARIRELTVLAGNAEFMHKAGLDVFPFPEKVDILHLGVNGRYAGCIDFGECSLPKRAAEDTLDSEGFFRFRDAEEAAKKRLPGEALLLMAPAAAALKGQPEDLPAAFGIQNSEAQIISERCGQSGVLAMLEHLRNARLGRKGALLVALIIKAVLLLLTVFGICPLWVAVLAELAVVAFAYYFSIHLLDFSGKY